MALRFATLDHRRDAVRACRLAGEAIRREMRCDSRRPRQTGALEYPIDRPIKLDGIVPANRQGTIEVHIVPGNAVLAISVDASGKVQKLRHFAIA